MMRWFRCGEGTALTRGDPMSSNSASADHQLLERSRIMGVLAPEDRARLSGSDLVIVDGRTQTGGGRNIPAEIPRIGAVVIPIFRN